MITGWYRVENGKVYVSPYSWSSFYIDTNPCFLYYIKRKNANNSRQTSWWKEVVLFFVKYLLDLCNQNVK